jgi:vacuolar-type H+-ATPase subunit I/STV1
LYGEYLLFPGWLPASDEAKLAEVLQKYDSAWGTEDPDPGNLLEIPIALRNNRISGRMSLVTEMYGFPPTTAWIRIRFSCYIQHGILRPYVCDMGYGALHSAIGTPHQVQNETQKGQAKNAAGILIYFGVSSFVLVF